MQAHIECNEKTLLLQDKMQWEEAAHDAEIKTLEKAAN